MARPTPTGRHAAVRVRAPLPGVRVLLGAFCVLTLAGFSSLFLLATTTDATFAWTIEPPATAAFLGAGYGAGCVLSALSVRRGAWADVRVPYVTVLVFTWLTTAATLLHLDRMHSAAPGRGPLAEPAAWFWITVYVVVPVAMTALLAPQERTGGRDPARGPRPPVLLRPLLAAQGVVLLGVGAALYLAPSTAAVLWPWPLTPLTARAVASWLLAFALAVALALRVDDLARLRTSTVAYAVFGVLQLLVLVRFAEQVAWGAPAAWAWTALLVAVTATGAAGWRAARRAPGGGPP